MAIKFEDKKKPKQGNSTRLRKYARKGRIAGRKAPRWIDRVRDNFLVVPKKKTKLTPVIEKAEEERIAPPEYNDNTNTSRSGISLAIEAEEEEDSASPPVDLFQSSQDFALSFPEDLCISQPANLYVSPRTIREIAADLCLSRSQSMTSDGGQPRLIIDEERKEEVVSKPAPITSQDDCCESETDKPEKALKPPLSGAVEMEMEVFMTKEIKPQMKCCICYKKDVPRNLVHRCSSNYKDCVGTVHQACLPERFKDLQKFWECRKCVSTDVLPWQGKTKIGKNMFHLVNTCPIDGLLTAFYIHWKNNPDFESKLLKDEAGSVLLKALKNFKAGRYDKGRYFWIHFVFTASDKRPGTDKIVKHVDKTKGTTFNVFGSQDAMVLDLFTDNFVMRCLSCCPIKDCPQKTYESRKVVFIADSPQDVQHLLYRIAHGYVESSICKQRLPKKPKKSASIWDPDDKCHRCAAHRNISKCTFKNKCPIMLPPIQLNGGPYKALELAHLPSEYIVDGKRFELRVVTIHHDALSHFTAFIRVDRDWYFYDSMAGPMVLLEIALETYDYNVQTVHYFATT